MRVREDKIEKLKKIRDKTMDMGIKGWTGVDFLFYFTFIYIHNLSLYVSLSFSYFFTFFS